MPRKGVENLITNDKRSSEEVRRNSRKGGIASGEARRRKRDIQETLQTLMSMPLKQGDLDNLDEIQSLAETNGKNITVQEGVVMAQLAKALKGDARSATILLELLKMRAAKDESVGVQIIDDF